MELTEKRESRNGFLLKKKKLNLTQVMLGFSGWV
jgi:hypothetical protein